jgi:hypothetical protein
MDASTRPELARRALIGGRRLDYEADEDRDEHRTDEGSNAHGASIRRTRDLEQRERPHAYARSNR